MTREYIEDRLDEDEGELLDSIKQDFLVEFDLVDILGCGDFGCVYRTADDTAIKITADDLEYKAWKKILDVGLEANPGLAWLAGTKNIKSYGLGDELDSAPDFMQQGSLLVFETELIYPYLADPPSYAEEVDLRSKIGAMRRGEYARFLDDPEFVLLAELAKAADGKGINVLEDTNLGNLGYRITEGVPDTPGLVRFDLRVP